MEGVFPLQSGFGAAGLSDGDRLLRAQVRVVDSNRGEGSGVYGAESGSDPDLVVSCTPQRRLSC